MRAPTPEQIEKHIYHDAPAAEHPIETLKQIQRVLQDSGLYDGPIDGRWRWECKEAFGAALKAADLEESGPKTENIE